MKLTGIIFLLHFCLFSFESQQKLYPNNMIKFNVTDDQTFTIILDKDKTSYKDYIIIALKAKEEGSINPLIYIAKNENCETDRLFVGTQLLEPILTFFKKDQIEDKFYICIKKRQNWTYGLEIMNKKTVTLGYNYQANYYVTSESMREAIFSFIPKGNDYDINTEVTFWVKGKNITNATLKDFTKKQYDHGYVFYGQLKSQENELTVKCEVGDYITVGSITIKNGETNGINENSNEIMIASKNEICIPVIYDNDFSFITGNIYTNDVKYRFTDNNKKTMVNDGGNAEGNITNSIINVMNVFGYGKNNPEKGYYCLQDMNNDLIIFSIQMTNDMNISFLFFPPLVPGEIKRHYLNKYQIGIFYGMKPDDNYDEINFNLKSLKGFPDMYYTECNTFPNCQYTEESIKNLNKSFPSNMITVHSTYKSEMENKNFTPITTFQPLMIVYCGAGGKKEEFEDSFCEFETSYFTDKDSIYLPPDSTFSQYLSQDEIDNYKINLLNKDDIKKIYLDMMIFSGDSDLELPHFEGNASKFYLSNKIFYSIHFNNDKPDFLEFKVKANDKTFYMIQYKLLKSDSNDDMNTIESGVNYITSKRYDSSDASTKTPKHIQFLNFKSEFDAPYLVTFYSPNCLFDVEWNKEKISNNSYVLQKIIDKNSTNYGEQFDFYYTIKKDDDSQYPKKFCMVYAAGLELSNSLKEWNKRSISISEGVPHRYTYSKKYSLIFYSYQISDTTHTLVFNFNLIDNYYFDIYIYINNINVKNTTIYRNSQIIFKKDVLSNNCKIGGNEFEVCTVDVRIQMRDYYKDIAMEFTIYQVDNNPFYLGKNVVTDDVINGNYPKHYYFDISNEEYGDITLDFKRGSGFIYVSVEEQNLTEPMNNPDWRGIYHFPTTIDESLKFVTYGKKIIINPENTTQCENGCYVLITVVSNILDDPDTLFRISINPRIIKKGQNIQIPKVRININDFIVGDIISSNDEQRKYDYYSIILPFQSDKVIFDWQADGPSLLINVGSERPTKGNAHFEYNLLFSDFVYPLNRSQILKKLNISDINQSIKGVELTIGIYSDIVDSIYSSPYAFKIFMPPFMAEGSEYIVQMIHIRTDQKVQCLPFNYNNTKICLFATIVDDTDENRNLTIYPKSQDGLPIKIYGKLVKSEEVELNDVQVLMKYLVEVFNNGEYLQQNNFVYIHNVKKDESFFFVTTSSENEAIVEVLSSTFTFYNNMTFYPNPSTAQIFAIGEQYINLNFSTTKDLLLNIVCVYGRGRFYWEENRYKKEYYLNGYNDRLSLTTHTNQEQYVLAPLIAKSDILDEEEIEKGGFIFYITYYPRGNADQIQSNRNIEFHYRTIEMPLSYYIPITQNSWTINLNFYDINIKGKTELEYESNQNSNVFNIWATIITRDTALKIRTDNNIEINYNDSCIKGLFDSTFGFIYLNSDFVQKTIKELNYTENPNIFLKIEKSNNISEDFQTLGYEINVFSEKKNNINQVTEGIFISGKLSNSKNKKLIYLLKCDKNRLYMSIQYEANSDFVKFALSNNSESETNDNFKDLKIKKFGGTKVLTILLDENSFPKDESIYLIAFTKEKNLDNKLDNFLFKYKSSSEEQIFTPMLTKEQSKILVKRLDEQKLRISFYSMPQRYTSYYIKAYYEDGYINGEKIHTIAITESPGEYKIINDPDDDGILNYEISPKKNISFIKIMARSNVDTDMRFYLYTPVLANNTPIPDPEEKESDDDGKKPDGEKKGNGGENEGGKNDDNKNNIVLYVSIGVGSAFVVIIIILIVFVALYKKKNTDLMKQVNKISFVQSGAQERESGDDLLLGKDD